jgi:ELWxxDGT repeat protein
MAATSPQGVAPGEGLVAEVFTVRAILPVAVATILVVLPNPGFSETRSSIPDPWVYTPAASGSALYFQACDMKHGCELWRSDGTAAGTRLVRDIRPGAGSSTPIELTDVGGTLYFVADDGRHGPQLWATDGSLSGTRMVYDIGDYTANELRGPEKLIAYKDRLYFRVNSPHLETGLWTTDGTKAGTRVAIPDSVANGPDLLTVAGEILYFMAVDGRGPFPQVPTLWRTDGTVPGTRQVIGPLPGSVGVVPEWPSKLSARPDGILIFAANDPVRGQEPWRSDGSATGTFALRDINVGSDNAYPSFFTHRGSETYFMAYTPATGIELWKTDATVAGTVLVHDICPGPCDAVAGPPWTLERSTFSMASVDGLLYLQARNFTGTVGDFERLWQSDGTPAGTMQVPGAPGAPYFLTAFDGALFYQCNTYGYSALCRTDRTGTEQLGPWYGSGWYYWLVEANGKLFFPAIDLEHGRELWATDGTAAGTVLVKDICTAEGYWGNPGCS